MDGHDGVVVVDQQFRGVELVELTKARQDSNFDILSLFYIHTACYRCPWNWRYMFIRVRDLEQHEQLIKAFIRFRMNIFLFSQ